MSESSNATATVMERPESAAAPATGEAESLERELTLADRCDVCGAQAFVRVLLSTGELLFCGHHGREHGEALKAKALFIQDETAHILTA